MRTRSHAGSVSVVLVIAIAVLALAAVALVTAGARDHDLALQRADGHQAFYAAEAGLHMALRELATNTDHDADGIVGSISDDANPANNPSINNAPTAVAIELDDDTATLTAIADRRAASRDIAVTFDITYTGAGGEGVPGCLLAEYWHLSTTPGELSDIPWSDPPDAVASVHEINFPKSITETAWSSGPTQNWAVRFTATITIPADGTWTFYTNSDDGSDLSINGTQVVDNDGQHSARERSGTIDLTAGTHTLQARMFERTGNAQMIVSWAGPTVPIKAVIPASAFSCDPPDTPAIYVTDSLLIDGDGSGTAASIDGYDSTAGPYGGSNAITDQLVAGTASTGSESVEIKGRAEVDGDFYVGVGGNPSNVIKTDSGGSITGTASAMTIEHVIPMPSVRPDRPSSSGDWTIDKQTRTLSSDKRYTKIEIKDKGKLVISGHRHLYVDEDFILDKQSKIEINANSSLTLYISKKLEVKDKSEINANTEDPALCRIFMLGSDDVNILDKSEVHALIIAPNAKLTLDGNGNPSAELFGTFRGKHIEMKVKSRIHADISRTGTGTGAAGGTAATTYSITGFTQPEPGQ